MTFIWILLLLAQPIPPRLFEVPDHGRLRMIVPFEWKVSSRSSKQPPAVVVHIAPSTGDAFDIQLTSVWLDVERRQKMTPDAIRSNVRRSADTLLQKAEDKSVIMEDLKGEQVTGNYYTLADSDPKPGEYRYVTQGSFITEELLTAFTIQHRQPKPDELARSLRMLAGATHVP